MGNASHTEVHTLKLEILLICSNRLFLLNIKFLDLIYRSYDITVFYLYFQVCFPSYFRLG